MNLADWGDWRATAIGGMVALAVVSLGFFVRGLRRPPSRPVLPDGEMPFALDPFHYGNNMERRRALRRQGNPVGIVLTPAEGVVEPWKGLVVDRSVGGLGLLADESAPVGAVLSVRSERAPPVVPWVHVEVRHCRPEAGRWKIGTRFLQTLPSDVLWQFG